jgi:hypothetical protein
MKDICGLIPIGLSKTFDEVLIFRRQDNGVEVPRYKIRCLPTPPVNIPTRIINGNDEKFKLKSAPQDANSILIFQEGNRYVGMYAKTDFTIEDHLSKIGFETRTLAYAS